MKNQSITGPTVLNYERMTEGQKRYWLSETLHNRLASQGVTLIDPFRRPLRELRARFRGQKVYRASTGGRYGKSSEIVAL